MKALTYPDNCLDTARQVQNAGEVVKRTGGYNDFPPGWRRISVKTFAQSVFFSYEPDFIEHRQMIPRKKDGSRDPLKPMVHAVLYFFWNRMGIGIVNDHWKGKVSYFSFGCEHHFNESPDKRTALGGTLLVCSRCGFEQGKPDSSD